MVSTTVNRVSYSGDGVTTQFAFPYYFIGASDLVVMTRGGTAEATKTIVTDYTVSGAGQSVGGTVTFLSAPDATTSVLIFRNQTLTQTLDLIGDGELPAENLETAFDKLCMMIQRLNERMDRAAVLRPTDTSLSMVLPFLSDRTSSFLGFDSSGRFVPFASSVITGTTVTPFATTMLDDASASAVLTTLGVTDYMQTLLDDANASTSRVTLGVDGFNAIYNAGFAAVTVSQPNDAVVIRGRSGDLGTGSILSIPIESTSTGLVATLYANTNTTITLTGAHWGLDTLGDVTAAQLAIYGINDSGSLKFGVSYSPHLRSIASSNATTTASAANNYYKMLTNATVTSGTWNCVPFGLIFADFDDTGGASEDLWAINTSRGAQVVNKSPVRELQKKVFGAAVTTTWVIPITGIPYKCTVVGSGGGGGGGNGSSAGGGGGGGGGTAIKWLSGLTAGNTLSVTVSPGGTAGGGAAGGGAGAATILKSGTQSITQISAGGGGGGGAGGANGGVAGVGGTPTGGDLNIYGQSGAYGLYITAGNGVGGVGGASVFGGGGQAGYPVAPHASLTGFFGAGGAGGGSASGTTNGTGSAGGDGAIIIEWAQ